MIFTQTVMPQYRDADEDGLIGLRGFMRYFQDIHTWFMHELNKGNDVLPEAYGAGWVYTRTHVHLDRKADFTGPVRLEAWMEPWRQPVLVTLGMHLSQHGVLLGTCRVDCCVVDLSRRRVVRLSAVDFPEGLTEERDVPLPRFIGVDRGVSAMEKRYVRTVRYSDLDKNRHMNNLRYVEMFEDAHDSAFWEGLKPAEMELSFITQCVEGEELTVCSVPEGNGVRLAALHADGSLASVAYFGRGAE